MYDIAINFFDNIDDKYIVDAYSGTGTIGMIMAKKAKKSLCYWDSKIC